MFDRLRDGLVIAGVASATIGGINTLPQAALAITVNRPDLPPNEAVVRMLADLNMLFFGPLSIFLSLTIGILAAILLSGGIARRWVGWIALASAVTYLIGGSAAFFPNAHGKPMALGTFGLVGLLLFLVTILITSFMLLSRAKGKEPSRP